MIEQDLVRDALTQLLRNDDKAAWDALILDGWLDLAPEADGTWPLVSTAVSVAGTVGSAGRPLPVGAHLAAAVSLARAGDVRHTEASLGVALDLRVGASGGFEGRAWSGPSPVALLLSTVQGQLGVVPGRACALSVDPMPSFAEVDVRRVVVDASAVVQVGDAADLQLHEAGVAFLLAAEALSAVQVASTRTMAYLRDREAFGQPLGSFQALQHRAVDVHTVSLLAASLLELGTAAWEAGVDPVGASWRAKVFAGTRGVWAAEQAIQLHGGIGFTWELGLHQILRRAQRARLLLGGPARSAAEVVAAERTGPRPGLTDWTLREIDQELLAHRPQ